MRSQPNYIEVALSFVVVVVVADIVVMVLIFVVVYIGFSYGQ